ncbi:MAG: ABC transporter permease [Planctomycetaceae bacterium]|jgi:putative ABC transport system permease protein
MNLLLIAWKNLLQRRLASALTALSIGLGVMLMVLVLVISGAVETAFTQRSIGYDLIVGPKGSDLQLVLSAVYRIQPPIENLPAMYLDELQADRRVVTAVPLAFGDVTQEGGFPIVGTTTEYFENDYLPGQKFEFGKGGSRIDQLFEAIIGADVARQNGWTLGSTFPILHGGAEGSLHDEEFTVVAVLAPTGTANDRTVFLNLESFYAIDGHEKPVDEIEKRLRDFYAADQDRLDQALAELDDYRQQLRNEEANGVAAVSPRAMQEVTAVLVKTRPETPFDAISLSAELQKGFQAMAVNPIRPIQRLMTNVIGNVQKALVVMTGLIILVSGVSIFVSIYNSMSDRRREIAVMRSLGAGRHHVFGIILAESALLCTGGAAMGWLTGHGVAVLASPWLIRRTGLLISPWTVSPWELTLFPALAVLGILVGFLPAMTAYRTNVADALNQ